MIKKSANLLIVFAKNPHYGSVKTRLAEMIGKEQALEIYTHLFQTTECIVKKLNNCDVHVYFTESTDESSFAGISKFLQQGEDLGERMRQAFEAGFSSGYNRIVGIGTDLPDLTAEIIHKAITKLDCNELVFGPAEDGGYYLLGMNQLHASVFENKLWSTENLLQITIEELKNQQLKFHLLETKNDIDTYEDFLMSTLAEKMPHIKPSY